VIALLVGSTTVATAAWLIWLARGGDRGAASMRWVGGAALGGLALWLGMVAFYAPVEATQGVVQKIFYAHVPNVVPSYLGFGLTAIGGVGFLATRRIHWEQLSVAGAEVGLVFCTLILVTGPIWAKPVWGHWWVWDLRLTSTLILWFIYVAYLLLRSFAFGSDAARTFSSIYGIAGILAVPFVYFAVDLARGDTLHPTNPAREGLPPEMAWTLAAGMLAYLLVFAWFAARRLAIARLETALLESGGAEV
jgi:heme exporter protein C